MAKYSKEIINKFWEKVKKTDYCWNWINCPSFYGYGLFYINKKAFLAHRISFEINGNNINNKILDHLCRNKICVNPQHLEIVTRGENARRGLVSKLIPNQIIQIRKLYKRNNITQNYLANIFHVGQDEISRIINKKRWVNI